MSKKKEDIPKSERSEIVNNILGAKDRKEQLKIEADLHLTSVTTIKEILKGYGVNLKIFNGGSRKKKHIEDELAEEQEIITPVEEIETVEEQAYYREKTYTDEALEGFTSLTAEPLPPLSNEERVCEPAPEKILYTKPEILDGPPLPKSSTSVETAADSIDIDLSYQRFKALIRDKMHCENRLEEIKAELQLYRDTCNCILLDLKEGGIET